MVKSKFNYSFSWRWFNAKNGSEILKSGKQMEKDHLLHSRIRSLRSRKRIIKKDVEKQIRKKYKRSNEHWEIEKKYSVGFPLEQPYQRGIYKILRGDEMM